MKKLLAIIIIALPAATCSAQIFPDKECSKPDTGKVGMRGMGGGGAGHVVSNNRIAHGSLGRSGPNGEPNNGSAIAIGGSGSGTDAKSRLVYCPFGNYYVYEGEPMYNYITGNTPVYSGTKIDYADEIKYLIYKHEEVIRQLKKNLKEYEDNSK